MIKRAVTNSTCLIALEQIDKLNLLKGVFSTIFAPPAVQIESGVSVDWLFIESISNMAFVSALKTQIDEGEAQAIALAVELGNTIIILDDKKARRIAKQLDLHVIGTLGVILCAKREGLIPKVRPLLIALQQVGFYMTDELYNETLKIASEDISPLNIRIGGR